MSATGQKKATAESINQFNAMREEQRQLSSKISQLEMESREFKLVIDVLQKVQPERKCYRMVGDVLVERTAGDVLPTLVSNRQQMDALVEQMKQKLEAKGSELVAFKEKHNIRIAGERQDSDKEAGSGADGKSGESGSGGVLVA